MSAIPDDYQKIKENYPDNILLYQQGIFFRIMREDAKKVSDILGLKLRVEGDADAPLYFCGFPKSGLDKYVGKLIRAGFPVAICSQTKAENGDIRREVGEVIRCLKT